MARHRRRYPFKGSTNEYLQYLENKVALLANRNAKLEWELHRARSQSTEFNLPSPSDSSCTPNLVFQIETPEIAELGASTFKPRWEDATADFLARVPSTETQWFETRSETQLSTPEQVVDAWRILILRSPFIRSAISCKPLATPFAIIEAYQRLQGVLRQHAANSTQLSNYSLLLFFCICIVARQQGMNVEEVDKLTEACLPERQPSSAYWMRLRGAAKWAAGLIEKLEVKLGCLGSQLFVLCGPPLATYKKWAEWKETNGYLFDQITAKISPLTYEAQKDICISFSPVFLIAYSGPWRLDDVNKALGTDLNQQEYECRARVVEEIEARVEESRVQATPGEAEFPPRAGNADGYPPDLDDTFVALRPSEDNSAIASKGCGVTFLADERTSSWPGVLAQATTQPVVGNYLPDVQESARLGRAFVQTGNPDVMLGGPEAGQSHYSDSHGEERHTNTGLLMGEGEELFLYQD